MALLEIVYDMNIRFQKWKKTEFQKLLENINIHTARKYIFKNALSNNLFVYLTNINFP